MRFSGTIIVTFMAVAVAGCVAPSYIDKADKGASSSGNPFSSVVFHVSDSYKSDPPKCVAVLPFKTPPKGKSETAEISVDQVESVRRAFYAHLSPQGKSDVEIPRVDFVLAKMSKAEQNDLAQLGEKLNCDALVTGEVTEYGSSYFAVYSKVAVGASLKMVRASDGTVLWEGQHVAASHGGEIPLSPIGLAMGLLDAANNVDEEQLFRVIDDLARRLVSTIPDNRIAVLEEPVSPIKVAARKKPEEAQNVDDFLAALKDEPKDRQKAALTKAIKAGRFDDKATENLYQALIDLTPDEAAGHTNYARYLMGRGDYDKALKLADKSLSLDGQDSATYFLKSRILVKLDKLTGADAAIVRAVAIDNGKTEYFNALGYVNSLRGNDERALAAYKMSLERDPANGFAFYNTGVTLFNRGDKEQAANAFYGAGLSYLKSGDYGQAEKAMVDLTELASQGLDLGDEIKTLQQALDRLTKGEVKNVD